jgi:hypothetical protein
MKLVAPRSPAHHPVGCWHLHQRASEGRSAADEWQTAIGCLIGAAEGRDFMMHARIGVLLALNRNVERMLTDRKEMHWGRRKLRRDQ